MIVTHTERRDYGIGITCVWIAALLVVLASGLRSTAETTSRWMVSDTLQSVNEASSDASACLRGLIWEPSTFTVVCQEPEDGAPYDKLIRFPSPLVTGSDVNDRVALAWYMARDEQGRPLQAPAVLVVHESGSAMPAGKLFALGLQAKRIHALLIHLPYYGLRRDGGHGPRPDVLTTFRQAIADARRARDVIAALPHVDPQNIGVQGTSLGGFVAALTAAIDDSYQHTFVVLAGADLYDLVMHGERDTARWRESLLNSGYTAAELKKLFWEIEPTRIAHRLDADSTWLYSALGDRVIPPRHARALAAAATLTGEHHQWLPGNHYSMLLCFPKVLEHMVTQIQPAVTGPLAK